MSRPAHAPSRRNGPGLRGLINTASRYKDGRSRARHSARGYEPKEAYMKWAALIAWVITAGGGFVLLSIWLMRGGMQQAQEAGNRIRPPLILSHFLLAAGGLVVWIIYLISDNDSLAWIAFAILAVVAVLGFTMFAIWLAAPPGRDGRGRSRNARRSCGTALPGLGRGAAWTACRHDCRARAAHRAGRRRAPKEARVGERSSRSFSGRMPTEVISRSCSWPDRERRDT